MELLKRQRKVLLSLWLTMICLLSKAQSFDQYANPFIEEKPYEIGTYMGANRRVNLMVMVRQAKAVTIKVKDTDDVILHELLVKKSPRAYHYKLNFEDSQPGQYKLEISDGRKTLTHWIDVVDVPATEAQRYISFTSSSNH